MQARDDSNLKCFTPRIIIMIAFRFFFRIYKPKSRYTKTRLSISSGVFRCYFLIIERC